MFKKRDSSGSSSSSVSSFSFIRSFFRNFLLVCFEFGLLSCFILGSVLFWLNRGLPNLDHLDSCTRTPSVTVQAMDGTTLAAYGDLYEEFTNVKDLPSYVVNAFVAVEDRRFYHHKGIDFKGLIRAFRTNLKANGIVQGGSTLTQQLAKNILMTSGLFAVTDRSIKRKLQEVLLALKLESRFNKDQILTLYLNRVYFGAGTFGIDAASRNYFDKSAKHLNLFEAALLAGLLRAPSRFSPTSHPQESIERAKIVLTAMEQSGFIGDRWRSLLPELSEHFLKNNKSFFYSGSRYFANWVYETLPLILGPIQEDLIVVTTLNPIMQKSVEETCRDFHDKFGEEYKYSQTACMAMTADGAVMAMLGGLDYKKSQFNRATSALRQPGSSFKTFVYLTALEKGLDAEQTMIDDSPFEMGTYKPGNYKWKSRGEISMFEGYVYSVNSVCLRLAQTVGLKDIIKTAQRLGITTPLKREMALALGSCEVCFMDMMGAYAAFAHFGYKVKPYGIYEVRNKQGEVIYQHADEGQDLVVQEESLTQIKKMMRAVVARGTGRAANVDPHLFGKTGSNGDRDAWTFICRDPQNEDGPKKEVDEFSPHALVEKNGLVLGVWIGNDSCEKRMAPFSTGGRIPTRIAGTLIKHFLATTTSGLKKGETEEGTGERAGEGTEEDASEEGEKESEKNGNIHDSVQGLLIHAGKIEQPLSVDEFLTRMQGRSLSSSDHRDR